LVNITFALLGVPLEGSPLRRTYAARGLVSCWLP